MLWHVKEANSLFQSLDFDDDEESECVGFSVSEMTIFTSGSRYIRSLRQLIMAITIINQVPVTTLSISLSAE